MISGAYCSRVTNGPRPEKGDFQQEFTNFTFRWRIQKNFTAEAIIIHCASLNFMRKKTRWRIKIISTDINTLAEPKVDYMDAIWPMVGPIRVRASVDTSQSVSSTELRWISSQDVLLKQQWELETGNWKQTCDRLELYNINTTVYKRCLTIEFLWYRVGRRVQPRCRRALILRLEYNSRPGFSLWRWPAIMAEVVAER